MLRPAGEDPTHSLCARRRRRHEVRRVYPVSVQGQRNKELVGDLILHKLERPVEHGTRAVA